MIDTVTVVIPTYRAAAFIRRTLASVFAQTRQPDEVIVVDDCSPDDTVAVVEAVAATAPVPVRVIRLPANSGSPPTPTNVGIESAVGGQIATLDHDDEFPPNKLADQVPLLVDHPHIGLAFGDVTCAGPDAELNRSVAASYRDGLAALPKEPLAGGGFRVTARDATAGVIRRRCFVQTCSNMLFPKAVWRGCGGFDQDTTVSADMAFLAAVARKHDVAYLPTPSAVWRLSAASLYQTADDYSRVRDQLKVYADMHATELPHGLRRELRRTIRTLAFQGAYDLRKARRWRAAADCLVRGLGVTGLWREAILEAGKLVCDSTASAVGRRA